MKKRPGDFGSPDQFDVLRREQRRAHIHMWRLKAEEMRTIADAMEDAGSRRLMLNAAANYQRLANAAEEHESPNAAEVIRA